MMFELADQHDQIELLQLEVNALDRGILDGAPRDEAQAEDQARLVIEKRRNLREIKQIEIGMTGRMREAEFLIQLLDKIPAYSRES